MPIEYRRSADHHAFDPAASELGQGFGRYGKAVFQMPPGDTWNGVGIKREYTGKPLLTVLFK